VLYEEALDNDVVSGAIEKIRQADLLIVGGTSLAVYPAAGLIQYYRGSRLVLINLQPTPYDREADLIITGKIGQVLGQIEVN
jgi:NAD-dependent deacetylase